MSTSIVRSNIEREITAADFSPIFTIEEALDRKKLMNGFIGKVLVEGSDYGKIPGAGDKKVLLKAGAEKLSSIFGLAPRFVPVQVIEDWTGTEHGGEPLFYYEYRCELTRGGRFAGEGIGSCNSWESKYRYRNSARKCPACGAEAIIKGKEEYGGGWLCYAKKGGCGAKYGADAPEIVDQAVGKVPNPDFADAINTCQKMAQKRSLVGAILVVTNCSDAFTQDVDDFEEREPEAPRQAGPPNATAQRRIKEEQEKLDKQRAAKQQDDNPINGGPLDIAKMVKGFTLLKERLGPHTAVYYDCLKTWGVKHSNELRDKDKAKACYREMEGLVKQYEAMRDKDMAGDDKDVKTYEAEVAS